jgi:uncharacterized protein YjdB
MSEKDKNKNIILKICIAVLVMIMAIAICLIILSKRNETAVPESSYVSSQSSSSSFVQENSYEIELKVGETCKAELTNTETDSKPIWISSDNNIAVVDDYGNITAVSAGTCTVTVVMMDSDDTVSVTVNVK